MPSGHFSRALPGALCAVIVATLGSAAAPAAAAPAPSPVSVNFATSDTAVITSTHAHVRANVYADASGLSGSSPSYDASVELSAGGQVESHTWDFSVAASALAYHASGSGTLVVPAASVSPFGMIKLKFTAKGAPKKTTCGKATNYTLVQPESVSGTFYFNTVSGTNGWGTLGSKTKKFAFAKGSTLTTTYGAGSSSCGTNDPTPCVTQVGFDAGGGSVYIDGSSNGKGVGYLEAFRVVKLATPKGATRSDAADGTAKQVLTKTAGGGASLALTGKTRASGSALIAQKAKGISNKGKCGKKNTTSLTTTFWENASYTSGTPPLALTEQIYGPIVLRNPQGALISMNKH